jgi:hypothetical protein
MSARSTGMIAHLVKPGNLDDALDKVMLQDDAASPIPENPLTPTAEAPAQPGPVEVKPITRRSKASEKGTDGGILGELTALQKKARVKVTLNTRIDDWIDSAINKELRDLEESGVKGVTKEAIVNLSLVRGLKLSPPEGWEPI